MGTLSSDLFVPVAVAAALVVGYGVYARYAYPEAMEQSAVTLAEQAAEERARLRDYALGRPVVLERSRDAPIEDDGRIEPVEPDDPGYVGRGGRTELAGG